MAHVDLGGLWHEAAFRLVETYDVEVERGWRIALDRQPYGEVVRVLTGRCRFSLGGEHRDVGPGGIGILLPGPDRVTADLGEGPLRFRGFGFRVELFGAIELSGLLGLPLSIPHPWPALDDLVAETVRWGQDGGPADAFRARAHAELATAALVERLGDVGTLGGAVRREVAEALAVMEREPSQDLDVPTLAAAVHLSPKHFSRLFKSVVGVPPMTYLQALRVSRRAGRPRRHRPVGRPDRGRARLRRRGPPQPGLPAGLRDDAQRVPGARPVARGESVPSNPTLLDVKIPVAGGVTMEPTPSRPARGESPMGTTTETTGALEVTLTQEQIDKFHDRGFLRLEAITTAEEVTRLQGVYDRLFEPGALISEKDRLELAGDADAPPALPQIVNPDHYAPELRETVALRQRPAGLPPSCSATRSCRRGMHAIRKPAKDGAATPWHQDEAYWDPAYEHRGLSIWIPLQPATLENGCMQFVPGSHHLGVQPHQLINPDSHGLELAVRWSWSRKQWPARCPPAARRSTSAGPCTTPAPTPAPSPGAR